MSKKMYYDDINSFHACWKITLWNKEENQILVSIDYIGILDYQIAIDLIKKSFIAQNYAAENFVHQVFKNLHYLHSSRVWNKISNINDFNEALKNAAILVHQNDFSRNEPEITSENSSNLVISFILKWNKEVFLKNDPVLETTYSTEKISSDCNNDSPLLQSEQITKNQLPNQFTNKSYSNHANKLMNLNFSTDSSHRVSFLDQQLSCSSNVQSKQTAYDTENCKTAKSMDTSLENDFIAPQYLKDYRPEQLSNPLSKSCNYSNKSFFQNTEDDILQIAPKTAIKKENINCSFDDLKKELVTLSRLHHEGLLSDIGYESQVDNLIKKLSQTLTVHKLNDVKVRESLNSQKGDENFFPSSIALTPSSLIDLQYKAYTDPLPNTQALSQLTQPLMADPSQSIKTAYTGTQDFSQLTQNSTATRCFSNNQKAILSRTEQDLKNSTRNSQFNADSQIYISPITPTELIYNLFILKVNKYQLSLVEMSSLLFVALPSIIDSLQYKLKNFENQLELSQALLKNLVDGKFTKILLKFALELHSTFKFTFHSSILENHYKLWEDMLQNIDYNDTELKLLKTLISFLSAVYNSTIVNQKYLACKNIISAACIPINELYNTIFQWVDLLFPHVYQESGLTYMQSLTNPFKLSFLDNDTCSNCCLTLIGFKYIIFDKNTKTPLNYICSKCLDSILTIYPYSNSNFVKNQFQVICYISFNPYNKFLNLPRMALQGFSLPLIELKKIGLLNEKIKFEEQSTQTLKQNDLNLGIQNNIKYNNQFDNVTDKILLYSNERKNLIKKDSEHVIKKPEDFETEKKIFISSNCKPLFNSSVEKLMTKNETDTIMVHQSINDKSVKVFNKNITAKAFLEKSKESACKFKAISSKELVAQKEKLIPLCQKNQLDFKQRQKKSLKAASSATRQIFNEVTDIQISKKNQHNAVHNDIKTLLKSTEKSTDKTIFVQKKLSVLNKPSIIEPRLTRFDCSPTQHNLTSIKNHLQSNNKLLSVMGTKQKVDSKNTPENQNAKTSSPASLLSHLTISPPKPQKRELRKRQLVPSKSNKQKNITNQLNVENTKFINY